MVKELVHDPMFLGIKSKSATKEDTDIARDLLDTLMAHRVYIPPREHHLHGGLAPRSRCFSATLYGAEHHPL